MSSRPHASYAFELEDLPDAPDLPAIEEALDSIQGVRVTIVHPTKKAWVTAPPAVSPERLIEAFAEHGITATLSESSVLRREAWLSQPEYYAPRRGTKAMTGRVRRRRREEAAHHARARQAGFGRSSRTRAQAQPDVLYTARDLITPARLWIAVLFTLPVLIVSYTPQFHFTGWQWLVFALSIPVVTWCAFPFHRALVGGVRRGITALDGASSVAILLAFFWSAVAVIARPIDYTGWTWEFRWFALQHSQTHGPELFFDVACGITVLLLFGRRNSIRARTLLIDEMSRIDFDPNVEVTRTVKRRGSADVSKERVPVSELTRGDDVIVHIGETVPVDGQVVGGRASLRPGLIDFHEPNEVKVGSKVYAGSVIGDGEIKVRAERTAHATRWASVYRWLSEAEDRQRFATAQSQKSAAVLLPIAFSVAFASFALWGLISRDYNAAFSTVLAVLSCVAPVALALSPSLALRLGIEAAARHGVLVRDGAVLRALETVDVAVFNRTGALVEPTMTVETVTALPGEDKEMVLRTAGTLSIELDNPMAEGLVRASREAMTQSGRDPQLPVRYELVSEEEAKSGDVRGRVAFVRVDEDGHEHTNTVEAVMWRPTNLSYLPGPLAVAATSGGTPLIVGWKGKDRGVITMFDTFKDDAHDAIEWLESLGVETTMLTRDMYPVARRFANYLGISSVLAGITNDRKPGTIRALQVDGSQVAMVGDRAILSTLKAADVAMMYAQTSDLEASRKKRRGLSVVMLRHDVSVVPQLIQHARRVCMIIDRNLALSWTYNATAMTLAAAGFLPPIIATVLMVGSSLLIEGLSMRARKYPTY
ncbi:heavy metal translocating P-type ATPase [Corynebacterium aquatimens]|uniref:Cu+-exporting ATPase n=1 Tax=Corynebacterium aquatimens TaxID=1190508 RepID=A0A931E1Z3_9CORY|nr:HAD family hydrolase [Corynebacterium aquatimens]MBG6122452.1 Cu+-exporting ATPase [Corynebacterium aquatimens]WJY65008.1 putative copper-exporting P-type ATPase V [Corynebacterium aquatimens]